MNWEKLLADNRVKAHETSFEVLKLVLDKSIEPYAVYFDVCRRKRNIVEYDASSVATETEVRELRAKVLEFQTTEIP